MSEDKAGKYRKGSKTDSGFNKKPSASRRRPLNRHEMETPEDLNVSASAKKLKERNVYDVEVDPSFGYRFINFIPVFAAISNVVVCKVCHSNVTFTETSKRGLGFKLVISCDNCEKKEIPNSSYVKNAYEINRRIILAMRLLGVGLRGLMKFCAFMELPRPIFQSCYDRVIKNICSATEVVSKNSMMKAVEEEKIISAENGEENGITISGDGSWRKRGFTSLYGLVSVIGWYSGKVVDAVVKSKYCKSCQYWKNKEETEEYAEWLENHANECQANHEGSAGKMEVDAVVEMFQRSETLHNVKYVNYIGDGDSKTFKGITDAKPYKDFIVNKKECIDHVQKRMGTRLRNLKKSNKGLGGKGKLTGKLIDELSRYYGLAIRRNSESIVAMKDAIWATIFHKLSTDENPQHHHCPVGEDSWCTWQKAKATNNLDNYKHKQPLLQEVYDAIKPVYEELTRDDLLIRCLGGFTQNNNESFNSTVWAMAPKAISSGKMILDIATNLAIGIFNDGFSSILSVFDVMDMKIGPQSYELCMKIDAERIRLAELSVSEGAKEARINLKALRKQNEEDELLLEGQLYGPGISD